MGCRMGDDTCSCRVKDLNHAHAVMEYFIKNKKSGALDQLIFELPVAAEATA